MKEFQDALEVVDLLEGEDKTTTEDDIRVSYGIDLFMNKEYNEGLMQFMMRSHRTPLLLLKCRSILITALFVMDSSECRLFPSLVPKEMLDNFQLPVSENYFADYVEPEGEDYSFAVSCLLPLLLADRTRLQSRKRDDMEQDAMAAAALNAVPEDEEMEQGDTPIQREQPKFGMAAPINLASRARRTKLATLIDTAIMQAMLVCPDSGALLQFVRNENSIDLVVGERSLKPAGTVFICSE